MSVMDSEWKLEHPGGSFDIEFRADGLNSFVCGMFPAKASWRIVNSDSETPTVYIDWGKYGEYELTVAADGESMVGSVKGQPDAWRKATRLRSLPASLPTPDEPNPMGKRSREGCGGCRKGCGDCGRGDD